MVERWESPGFSRGGAVKHAAKLNTGEIVELLEDNQPVRFAGGKWSLIGVPFGARPRKQAIRWVKTTTIAKRYSFEEIEP